MKNLYLTADRLGEWTGGSKVVTNELKAFQSVGETVVISRSELEEEEKRKPAESPEPWKWDELALRLIPDNGINLAHGYAGTFSKSVKKLKDQEAKVSWCIAAHDVELSRKAHTDLGLQFNYPHLTDPELWKQYIEGYRLADVLVAPGKAPKDTLVRQGLGKDVRIIPHGCDIPKSITPLPKMFTVGYLGSIGADKGVRYLLEAWKNLRYKDAMLLLAGRESLSPWTDHLIATYGGGNIIKMGWVNNISDFFNKISMLVCPAVTEGFNIEVLEAMAHGRMSLCSNNAGAADLVAPGWRIEAENSNDLAGAIDYIKTQGDNHLQNNGKWAETQAKKFSWLEVRNMYIQMWIGMQ